MQFQKIDPKVPKRRYRLELQTRHLGKPGSNNKQQIFGPKSKNFGPKKDEDENEDEDEDEDEEEDESW